MRPAAAITVDFSHRVTPRSDCPTAATRPT